MNGDERSIATGIGRSASPRVLLWMPDVGRIPGGHQTQADQTARHLRALGIDARLSLDPRPAFDGFDLVHGFFLRTDQIRLCRDARVPVALSTIYWGRHGSLGMHVSNGRVRDAVARLRVGASLLRSAVHGSHVEKCCALTARLSELRASYEMADVLLPNSQGECDAIVRDLGVTTPVRRVPNAVDHRRFTPGEGQVARDHVLYVGRFEPHKNQLGLIRAMRGHRIPLVLAGPPHPDHPQYYEACRRLATGNVRVVPGRPHDELPDLYRAARVHVLPSWFETTGLVSLEAALCGCNVVTTSRGFAREYLGDDAWYCDPADSRSIRAAVEQAFAAPPADALRDRVLRNYTWEHTAASTVEAYELIRGRAPSRRDPAAGDGLPEWASSNAAARGAVGSLPQSRSRTEVATPDVRT